MKVSLSYMWPPQLVSVEIALALAGQLVFIVSTDISSYWMQWGKNLYALPGLCRVTPVMHE